MLTSNASCLAAISCAAAMHWFVHPIFYFGMSYNQGVMVWMIFIHLKERKGLTQREDFSTENLFG
jgi:hypothetical protein